MVERPGGEVNQSPPFSAEVKYDWSHTSAPPLCLRGVDKENFTFCVLLQLTECCEYVPYRIATVVGSADLP
jgi:hypothetical protein